MCMAFLGLLLKRTFSLHEKINIYKELREEYFEHKQIAGALNCCLKTPSIYELFYSEKKAQQIHFNLKIKDCILYIKALFACLISQKT